LEGAGRPAGPDGSLNTLVQRGLRLATPAAALAFMAVFIPVALARAFYPYDLDFIEDGLLLASLRFSRGQPVYMPPSVEFTAPVYPPLFEWIGGLLFRLTGPGYAPLRLLSLAATLAAAGLVYWIARREAGPRWLALACAGLLIGGYQITGFWYDLARVDALFVALALGGCALGVYAKGRAPHLAASAAVLALAFFTKQTAALFVFGLAVYLFATEGRRAWWFVLVFAGLVGVALPLLDAPTGGWLVYYNFKLGSAEAIEAARVLRFLGPELLGKMGALSLMAVAAAWLGLRRALASGWLKWRGLAFVREQPWLNLTAMAAIASAVGRGRIGGNLNNLMPVYTFLCLAPAVLRRNWPEAGRGAAWGTAVLGLAILAQFARDAYNPFRIVPSAAMRQSGDRLVQRIAAYDGDVLVMMHPYYAMLAGKLPSAQVSTFWYAYAHGGLPLPADFAERLNDQYYAALISDESDFETDPAVRALIDANYYQAETLDESLSPPTNTGVVVRPQVVYLPIQREGAKRPAPARQAGLQRTDR
jgi:Dolichyl-phosphate-mannose-protein mannosyltransferase